MINHIQLLLAISSGQDVLTWIVENSENFRRANDGLLLEYKNDRFNFIELGHGSIYGRIPDDCYIYGDIGFGNLEYPL